MQNWVGMKNKTTRLRSQNIERDNSNINISIEGRSLNSY